MTVTLIPTAKPYEWHIDIGPFFDRFGASKLAVLTSADPVVQAIVKDCQVRKWIDLRLPSVSDGLDALIACGVPGVDSALKDTILNTPVAPPESSALRATYYGETL